MDTYELLDRFPGLRRTLWVWNGVCATAVAACVVATVALIVDAETSDAFIDLSGPAAAGAFALGLLVCVVWAAGRGAILLVGRALYRRGRSDVAAW